MSNTRKVAYNTAVQIASRAVVTIISIVALAYIARYLGVIGMGKFNLIFAYLGLFGVVLDFGFFLLQIREITKTPEREGYIIGNVFGLKLALSLIVFSAAYVVAIFLYHDPIITMGVLIGAVSQASLSFALVPVSLFQARLQMDRVAITNIITRLIYIGTVIWAIRANWGVMGIVIAATVANVSAFIIQSALIWPQRPIIPCWDLKYWWHFIKQAAPLGAVVVLATIYFRIDSVILSLMKGDYAVGIYTTPYKVVDVALSIPTIFMSSVFPILTKAWNENKEATVRIFRKAFDVSALLGFPIVVGTMLISVPLMVAIAGQDFAPSGVVLKIIIWSALMSFFGAVLNYTIIAAGRQSLLTLPYVFATIFNIVANIIFIPHYSYIGAAYITVITEAMVMVYAGVLVFRLLRITPAWVITLKAALASAVMAGAMYWSGIDNLIVNILLGMAVYGVTIFLIKAVPREILKELKLVKQ
jgi:O-antigen/teichoic acid export membrane protein